MVYNMRMRLARHEITCPTKIRDQTRVKATIRKFAGNSTTIEHQHRRKVLAYRHLAVSNPNSVEDGLCHRKYRILRALIGESIKIVHEALHSRVEIRFGTAGFAKWMGC